jgi:hypothetical protein
MDRHYTPSDLARRFVKQLPDLSPRFVADFAAGEGALLHAARERWPSCGLIATDINHSVIHSLSREFKNSDVGRCDFLSERSQLASPLLRRMRGHVPLVLINPPFSCRGGRRYHVDYFGTTISCSIAMAFVILSVRYLSADGCIVAILPSSCLTSAKDGPARDLLSQHFAISKFGGALPYDFQDCRVEVAFVALTKRLTPGQSGLVQSPLTDLRPAPKSSPQFNIKIGRGQLSMHRVRRMTKGGRTPLIHTTELRNGAVDVSARLIRTQKCMIRGPAIFFPRVGKPDFRKLCFYDGKAVAISDCIIAIQGPRDALMTLYQAMKRNWPSIAVRYVGSCAKYLTLAAVQDAVDELSGSASSTMPPISTTALGATENAA